MIGEEGKGQREREIDSEGEIKVERGKEGDIS